MNEALTFDEKLQRPTKDGKSYEPYFVKTITVDASDTFLVTCIDSEAATESIYILNALQGARYTANEEYFRFEDVASLNPTQFRLTGDLRGILGELVRAGCISKDLHEKILLDEKFNRLCSTNASEGELAALIKAHKPELWDALSTSPETLQRLVRELERDVSKNSPRSNPSQPTLVK